MKDVFDRIDTSHYFDGVQKYIAGGWAADPKTELLKLSASERRKWKMAMRKGSEGVLNSINTRLVQAIDTSR